MALKRIRYIFISFLVLFIAFCALDAGYSYWTDSMSISGNVSFSHDVELIWIEEAIPDSDDGTAQDFDEKPTLDDSDASNGNLNSFHEEIATDELASEDISSEEVFKEKNFNNTDTSDEVSNDNILSAQNYSNESASDSIDLEELLPDEPSYDHDNVSEDEILSDKFIIDFSHANEPVNEQE